VHGISDADYVERALDGTEWDRKTAFSALVQRHEKAVRNLLRQLTRNHAVADELAQDAFLGAWLKLATLKQPERFAGWVKRIAYREFLHGARRRKLEQHYANTAVDEPIVVTDSAATESSEELDALLAVCTPIEREIMILQFAFEFSQGEIADARGMAIGTVKSHVHRAKKKIRECLEAGQATSEQEDSSHG
jgi:RNA polymerase sigma-70 factor (ECF subfamily)